MRKVVVVITIMVVIISTGIAEDTYFVMCNPESHVNVHSKAKKSSEVIAWLHFGTEVTVDKEYNGFCHVIDLMGEETSGWVSKKYLDIWEPMDDVEGIYLVVADGRVAIRNAINGKVKAWLQPGESVEVFAMTAEWAIVNKGFVRAEFLVEVEDEEE